MSGGRVAISDAVAFSSLKSDPEYSKLQGELYKFANAVESIEHKYDEARHKRNDAMIARTQDQLAQAKEGLELAKSKIELYIAQQDKGKGSNTLVVPKLMGGGGLGKGPPTSIELDRLESNMLADKVMLQKRMMDERRFRHKPTGQAKIASDREVSDLKAKYELARNEWEASLTALYQQAVNAASEKKQPVEAQRLRELYMSKTGKSLPEMK